MAQFFKKKLLNIKCVFWFFLQLLSETFLILKRTEQDTIKVYHFSCKVPIILVIFQWNYFFDRFSKNIQIQNLLKLSPVGAWLFQVDGQTFDISNSCLFVILRTHPVTCYYNKLQCYLWFLRLLIFSLLLLLKVMELNKHVTLKMNSEVCNSFISPTQWHTSRV